MSGGRFRPRRAQPFGAIEGRRADGLDRVVRCAQLQGFVNCEPGYTGIPRVVNGSSDLIVAVYCESGKHSRFAVGSHALPENIAAEIAAIFEVN
ncbi:MAG: RidA family protein [Planctomycetia bacterium]|nr:RidA family protein [Planctomycetia bacterium]